MKIQSAVLALAATFALSTSANALTVRYDFENNGTSTGVAQLIDNDENGSSETVTLDTDLGSIGSIAATGALPGNITLTTVSGAGCANGNAGSTECIDGNIANSSNDVLRMTFSNATELNTLIFDTWDHGGTLIRDEATLHYWSGSSWILTDTLSGSNGSGLSGGENTFNVNAGDVSATIWALRATDVNTINDWRLSEIANAETVPEPGTALLLGSGLLGLALHRRGKKA